MCSREKSVKIRNCRICFIANSDSHILFDIDSEWSRLFEYCVGIHVIDNNAPRVLCADCAEKLSEYAKFKECCLKSDTIWSSISKPKSNCSNNIKLQLDNLKVEPEIKEEVIKIEDDYSDDFHTYEDDIKNTNVEEGTYVKVETIEPDIPIYKKKQVTVKKKLNETCRKRRTAEVDDTCNNVNEDEKVPNKKDFILKYFEYFTVEKMGPDKAKKTVLQCCKCGRQYKRFNASNGCKVLLRHIKKCYNLKELHYENKERPKKPPSPLYYCGLCELKSPDSELIRQHVRKHYANNQFDCQLCDFKGRDIADIVAHRYKHHPPEFSHKILCTECPKRIGTVLKLEFHIRSDHLKTKGGWCSECNFTTKIYKTIRNHVRFHQGNKFVCDICGKNFLNRNTIKAHLIDHSEMKNFICDTCGKSFKRSTQLQAHIERMHTFTTPVACTHCNKTFKSKITLKEHMKSVNREKKYICNVCAKGYGVLCELKSHMFWHTGERPHKCETCGNRYKAKGQLKIHMRIHSGYKPFKCAHCDKAFTTTQQHKVHQAVHTGKRRNKCLFCDRTFNGKKLMLNHCKSAHKIEGTGLNCN